MENGARPAAGAHWLAAARPDFRAQVVEKIFKSVSHTLKGDQVDDLRRLHEHASRYEAKVFSQSENLEDYINNIRFKILGLQQKYQPPVQAASDLPQHVQMGQHQMPQTPPLQNTHTRVIQAQATELPPVAPVVQLHPCHQTVVTQQPQPRMNQQDLTVDQWLSYQAHDGQHANVAMMQTRQYGAQNNHQFGNAHPAGEVDWREDMFHKITCLKDAHYSELVEFGRALRATVLKITANGQLESLPKEQEYQYRSAQHTMESIRTVCNFLKIQKTDIPEGAKDQLDKVQTWIHSLLSNYRGCKARAAKKRQFCEPPQVENISGATDDSQQNKHEQHAAEALSHSAQDAPSRTPPTHQQNHSDNFSGEAEDNTLWGEAESPVGVNLPGDISPFTGRTCSHEIQQMHSADEAIPQLTQTVEPAGTSPDQQQTHSAHTVCVEADDELVWVQAEMPVGMEVNTARSSSPAVIHSLDSDMGVNLKRAFHHMTSDTMDSSMRMWFDDDSSGKSYHKKRKMDDSVVHEIRATSNKLVETDIKIHGDDTGGVDGTMIELCYNAVSLAPKLREVVCVSEISAKLLVHADYPRSSPVILIGDGEGKKGVPAVVDMAFRRALVLLPEPRSIEGMAKAWDSVVQRVVVQFAHRLVGGPFSARYGQWETRVPV